MGPYKSAEIESRLDEEDVNKIISYFVTKQQLESNSNLQSDEQYIFVRGNDKNEYIEQLINEEIVRTKKQLKTFIILFFTILACIFIIPVITAFIFR